MAIIIVDPDPRSREDAGAMVTWVDRRHRVDYAEDGTRALQIASERRPRIAFVAPKLPDMPGRSLCCHLRARFPRVGCVAMTNDGDAWDGFDFNLPKPPTRLEVLSIMEQIKSRARQIKEIHQDPDEKRWLTAQTNGLNAATSRILVSLTGEPMQFGVNVPEHATVGAVIEQLGKRRVDSFKLIRDGKEFESTKDTMMVEDDRLILKL